MPDTPSFDRREFLKVAGAIGVLSGSAETATAQRGRREEILVGVASSVNAEQTAQRALPSDARIIGKNDTLGYVRAELPERASATATVNVASTVASRPGVEYAEPNAIYETLTVPNDPRFGDQYAPEMVNAPAAWDTTFGDGDVTIAVVDEGIKYDHPDLEATAADGRGRDFVDDDDEPYPDSLADEQHGTHVAGIVAAGTDNEIGIAGISNATLLGVRVLDKSGSGYTADVADGIQWAADNGADVINLSLGGGFTETLQTAVSYAHEQGVLLVAAAGNDYGGSVDYPAAYDECLAVSALDPDGSLASYSNRGPEIDLAAPGTNVLSTWTDDGYETLSGTSMAAPVVSGVAALVLSEQDLSNTDLRERLLSTAVDVRLSSAEQGVGRVDTSAVGGELGNTVSIEGTGRRARYLLSASGRLRSRSGKTTSTDDNDTRWESVAAGLVSDGDRDNYDFSGELVALDLERNAIATLNGDRIDPDEYPNNVLTIEGDGSVDEYTLATSGTLKYTGANGATIDFDSDRWGSTATGRVDGGDTDSYKFSGALVAFDIDGDATAYLNGERIDPDDYLDNVLTIEGSGSVDEYTLASSGTLKSTGANGASIDSNDEQWGSTVRGQVGGGGRDSYKFSGALVALDVSGDTTAYLNGERIDPDEYFDNVVTIEGSGSVAEYTLASSGTLNSTGANGASIDSNDEQWGSTATGQVGGGGRDSYKFSGALVVLDVDGDATVYLNGERIDPDDYLDNVVTIEGGGSGAEYTLASSGTLKSTGANDASINSSDEQWGSTATGRVGDGGRDSYKFSGVLVVFDIDGDATAYLNGERIDPDDYLDNVLTIVGTGSMAEYSFSTSGTLKRTGANGATIDATDEMRGSTATGQVGRGGRDSYKFSGELADLDIDGEATAYLNGKRTGTTGNMDIGVYSGLSDANFDTIDRMEGWQNTPYAVQNLFVPWNPDEGHMNWLFDRILPRIWNAGRTPLITWEPYTPGARTASVDTQSLVERNEYDAYIESLASTTPNDIEVRIGNGEHDRYIDRWAGRLRDALAGSNDRRAYLRFAHEMNGDWYPWAPTVGDSSPRSYIEMWRRVHNRFDRQSVGDDLQWMWCVNAEDIGSYTAEQLYPGSRYVDWLSLDGYNWGRSKDWSSWQSPDSIYGDMLDRLTGFGDKRVCVAEFASSSKVGVGHDPQRKGEWIRDAITYFENRGVDMWCWFNEDKETDWAVFNGVRGTETVAHNGRQANAYSAYRTTVDTYASAAGTATESAAVERISDD
ncbi:S8 family peptidase [Halococcus sediminicola]|uniref:S8 family peptidase n=1 Tax=Halococcus sediminicola TaxID=1264579 RepID=UPI0009AEB5E8|nr:S8 family peptidase [Halococcus sediminicola]